MWWFIGIGVIVVLVIAFYVWFFWGMGKLGGE